MKIIYLLAFITCCCNLLTAQQRKDTIYRFVNDSMICSVSEDSRKSPGQIFTKVEQPAIYPGGSKVWNEYVNKEFKKPLGYNGLVWIQFRVELDGSLNGFQVLIPTKVGEEYEKYVGQFFLKGGKWFPARQNGYCVRSWHRIEF